MLKVACLKVAVNFQKNDLHHLNFLETFANSHTHEHAGTMGHY